MPFSRTAKIGIVGAGPAGLGAALALRDRGFSNVLVFEKADEVGGKCLTVELGPGVTYELGASSMSSSYDSVFALLERYGISKKPVDTSRYFNHCDRDNDPTTPPWKRDLLEQGAAFARFLVGQLPHVCRDLALLEPGFSRVSKADLERTFSKTLEQLMDAGSYGKLKLAIRTAVSGIGYGYIEEVPSAYHFKYLSAWTPKLTPPFDAKQYELFEVGFQGLFKRLAADLGPAVVKTASPVTRIVRSVPGKVRVTVSRPNQSEETVELDALILACPLDEALRWIENPSDIERRFEKVKNYTFHTILGKLEGYPAVRWGFPMHNYFAAKARRPVLTARRHLDLNRVVFYVLDGKAPAVVTSRPGPRYLHRRGAELDDSGPAPTDEVDRYLRDARDAVREELCAMKLPRFEPEEHVVWKYFPHFSTDDVRNGYPRDLEDHQGHLNTFYAGELLDFSVVERVLRHSQHLVKTHFA